VLRGVGFRQPRLVERYSAVGERCQPVRVSLDEHDMVALFGEHHGRRETNVPCADDGRAQIVVLQAPILADAEQPGRRAQFARAFLGQMGDAVWHSRSRA
jgi:hypothetical protein